MVDRRVIRDLVVALALVAALVLGVTRYVAVPWTVVGDSMEPTLSAGDRVIVSLWAYRTADPAPGEVALFAGPGDRPMVKRVVRAIRENGPAFEVAGDNPESSIDSRQFGPVSADRFRGRVIWRYWPVSRAGRIR